MRIESTDEQVGEQLADGRVVCQNLRDVALAERQAGLQQVAAICAQHRDHAPGNSRRERQLIETVAVHAASPHGGDGTLDLPVEGFQGDRGRGLHHQFQILDPAPLSGDVELVRPLRDYLQSHVLQHGQQVGNRNRILAAEDFQKKLFFALRVWPINIQMQLDCFLFRSFEKGHIESGIIPGKILGVGRRECLRILFEKLQRVRFVEAGEQRTLERIQPGAHGCRHAPFQAVGIHRWGLARRHSSNDVYACQIRLRDLHLGFHAECRKRIAYDQLDALAHLCVVFLPRHEYQA